MIAEICAGAAVIVAAAPWLLGIRRPARRLAKSPKRSGQDSARPGRWARMRRLATRWGRRPAGSATWPAALDALARATATGAALAGAVGRVGAGPGAPAALAAIAQSQRAGAPLAEATTSVAPADADDALAVATLAALATTGGPAPAALDRAAAVLRTRQALAAERDVAAAQATISARVMVVLPVAVGGWSALTGGNTAEILLGTPLGLACLGAGTALDLAGWWWMRRIIRPRAW